MSSFGNIDWFGTSDKAKQEPTKAAQKAPEGPKLGGGGRRGYTVSASAEDGLAATHDQREGDTPQNVAKELAGRNVYIKTTADHVEEFNDTFLPALMAYNLTQRRKDRKKSLDYYSEVKKPEKEFVLQIGDRMTAGVLRPEAYEQGIDQQWADAKEQGKAFDLSPWLRDDADRQKVLRCLRDIGEGLQERFPNFHFSVITLHDDEPAGTPHIHAGGFWVGEGYFQRRKDGKSKPAGVQKQCSMTRALENMGYKDVEEFSAAIRLYMVERMEEYGLSREVGKSAGLKRLPVDQFKQLQKEKAAFKKEKQYFEQQQQEFQREKLVFEAERQVMLEEVQTEREKAAALAAAASDALQDAAAHIAACQGWQQQQQRKADIDRRMKELQRDFGTFTAKSEEQQTEFF